ncbi:TetR/AcrR family transcriptional regulator [Kitasatospora paracochleata]|uniref:AcrR family transcriptional regulator n=1 Tax=Kitasatospora paracochleata TaxID=58354 RepID=A0ABT1J120_9ACTN|nr:TetR/AcrR family transcriptional regulator [Kitasatospora paracochleata]MCP2311115.1 AcrR family transcriptional regulator [Kitasatospora paracochleata]
MARPRGLDDAAILRATAEVMGRLGPTGLTLAAVAREVGLVPGTLIQRFGSKAGLLAALAEQSAREADALPQRVRRSPGSVLTALSALSALAGEWAAPLDTPERFANHLAFLCTDLTDPQLYPHALTVHRAQRRAIETLLTEAVATGELHAGTDVAALAGSVQAVVTGAGVTWALERTGTLAERIRHELDTALSPHRPSHQDDTTRTPEES